MNLLWVSRPSVLNVTFKKRKYIFLNHSSSLLWDVGHFANSWSELPCLPQLKCLDNIYCKFFSSTYIHLFIQTHFWHLSTQRVCPNCRSYTPCSSFMQGSRWIQEGLLNSKPQCPKEPHQHWHHSIYQQSSRAQSISEKTQPRFIFLCNPDLPTHHCLSDVRRAHWAPGSQALHVLKEETFIVLITTNEFIPSVSELSQAHLG